MLREQLRKNTTERERHVWSFGSLRGSKLSKAEVLTKKLHSDRIVHLAGWHREIHRLL